MFLQSFFLQFKIHHSCFMSPYNLDQSSAKLWDFLHFGMYFHAINQWLLKLMKPVNQHLQAHLQNLWRIFLTLLLLRHYLRVLRMSKWYFLKFIHYQLQSCVIQHFIHCLIRRPLGWLQYLEWQQLHLFVIYVFARHPCFLGFHFKQLLFLYPHFIRSYSYFLLLILIFPFF